MALDKAKLDALRIDRDDTDNYSGGVAKWWLLGIFLLAVAGSAAWWLLSDKAQPVATVVVQSPASKGQASVLNASGYVVARRIATVSSKVTGKIIEVRIEEGTVVEAGEVLARLDDSSVRARLSLTESQKRATQNQLREVQVRLDEARRNLSRARQLREKNLLSDSALETAQADVSALEARINSVRSEVEVAGRSIALAQQDLDDLTIRAPFSGVVISKNAQPGEMISPNSAGGGFTRTGICTIVDMDSREIEVDVNESYINRVYPLQPVEAVLDAYPDWQVAAQVINIVPTADRNRATVKVRISFDELDPRVLPDMGVKVRFLESTEQQQDTVSDATGVVPEASVFSENGKYYVWVVKNNELEKRAVRLGRKLDGRYEIVAGLTPGQVLVAAPTDGLSDGQKIEIK